VEPLAPLREVLLLQVLLRQAPPLAHLLQVPLLAPPQAPLRRRAEPAGATPAFKTSPIRRTATASSPKPPTMHTAQIG
jgi:hypothetical protein